MVQGFEERRVSARQSELYVTIGGSGPPALLLHGYPQTHRMWDKVATRLAERFTLVIPDLPGYGQSKGPPLHPEHQNHSKRETAATMVEAMASLGHERFRVVGHDRGARVSYRLALDHPARVEKLALLDIMPTLAMWEAADGRFAVRGFHWGFLAQRAPFPETLISAAPDTWMDYCLGQWGTTMDQFGAEALEAYKAAFRRPDVVAASCEDYRAGFYVDPEHDRADREAGNKIACPTLVLWGEKSLGRRDTVVLGAWRTFVEEPEGVSLESGHFLPEEVPEATARELLRFL